MRKLPLSLLLLVLPTAALAEPDLAALQARYAPVELRADLSRLSAADRQLLVKLIQAAQVMDGLYLRQVWAGNPTLLLRLAADRTPAGQTRLRYFLTHKGPWDEQNGQAPFIEGVPPKPPEASFYPAGTTKAEVEAFFAKLPDAQRAAATGFYTTLRRAPDGGIQVVPYSVEYQPELERAAVLLDEAAALAREPTLQRFLKTRAAAFRNNDYHDSEIAWMELDSAIEPTIGPYETYADEWFSYKAAFEAFITVRDDAETAKLAKLGAELQGLENALPIEPRYRNPKLGGLAPIRVVDQIYAAGDGDHAVKTAAYNLPNDEQITRERGSKRILLRNVQEAKFKRVLVPIAQLALDPAAQKNIDFDAFFTAILMHELMHGLGPTEIVVGGKKTTPRLVMKELYGALEEAKADISGMWALQRLVDKGTLPRDLERTMYDTYLAGTFRSLRFGTREAHGRGMAMQLNYLLDRGAVRATPAGTFAIDRKKIKGAVAALTGEIMTLQARGDYAGAKKMLDQLGVIRPDVQRVIDKMGSVPIDIAPVHATAEELLAGAR